MKPKAALLTFSETREEFYAKRKAMVAEEIAVVAEALSPYLEMTVYPEIRSKEQALSQLAEAAAITPDLYILHLPIWSSPNLAVSVARLAKAPLLLLGNERVDTSSLVGLLAAAGGLDQCGIRHRRVLGDTRQHKTQQEILQFARAATAVQRLQGSTFGCFGGRSLGIYTATADSNQWQKLFGVDVEHLDQSEILREAELASEAEVTNYFTWLQEQAGKIEWDDVQVTESTLKKQIRSYLALKKIINEKHLDFVGVKCQTEMSDHYCLQCLGVAMLNDCQDLEGEKQPVPCSCEADMDGALTMQILQLMAGGRPVSLMDVRHFDREGGTFLFANCGSMAPAFAGKGADGQQANWKQVHLVPHVFGKAGGAATQFVAAPMQLTLARLCRRDGQYWMAIFQGESVYRDREELRKTTWSFPHLFLKTKLDFNEFFQTFSANHVHAVEGDYVAELVEFCRLLGIPYRLY